MTQSIPERREAYRRKQAESSKQDEAKIETFMESLLVEARRRYPDVKMEWREREKWDDPLMLDEPELILQARLNDKDWYYAIKERGILVAPNYDEFLIRSISFLVSLIERELRKAQDA